MKPKILFTLIASFAFLFVFQQSIRAEKYPFRNYSVDDGLPHSSVKKIFQDRDGYMWFGTAGGGVSRFDGRNFTNYSTRDGLPYNWIGSILQDSEGNLWFVTGSGVSKFDGENWTDLEKERGVSISSNCGLLDSKGRFWFETYDKGIAMLEGDSLSFIDTKEVGGGRWILSIMEDRNGNIWVGTEGGALKYEGAGWTFKAIYFGPQTGVEGDTLSAAMSIFEDSRGNIWFGGWGAVSRFDGTDWRFYSLPAGFERFTVGSICEDREGNLWFGAGLTYPSPEKGVLKFDGTDWVNYTTENGLAHNGVISLFTDREGNVWLGTNGKGVCKFGGAGFTTYTTDDGLASNKIRGSESSNGILEDSRGNLWCLSTEGISRFDGKRWFTYNTENGLRRNNFDSVCEDRKGNIWFGSGPLVVKFDGRRFTNYPKEETGLYWQIGSILEDDKGSLWFGSTHRGAGRYDGKNWTNYMEQGKIPGFFISSTFQDSKGNLWFFNTGSPLGGAVTRYDGKNWITYTRKGLGIYDGDKGIDFYSQDSIVKYKYDQDKWILIASEPRGAVDEWIENYLTGDKISGIVGYWFQGEYFKEDSHGNVWLAAEEGVSRYDGENWKRYTTEDGLAYNKVRCIFEDSEGNLWFGTEENGISRFDAHGFTSYTTGDGLSSNICNYIFEHGDYLYIGTATGLSRFDGESFEVITERDGLASSELTSSYLADSKGNLWFATANGLTEYNPALDRPNVVLPPVYITKVSLFGKDISGQGYSHFSYKENNLRFDYIGVCLASPEDVVYRYKLEGLDSDWIETDEAFASYPYLPPGEYAFKVKACNNDGLWNEQPAELAFEIMPPFWATNWFRSMILAVILLSAWGTYAAKTRSIKRRNIELETKVEERTLALAESNYELANRTDELEESNIQLRKLNERLQELDELKSNFLSTVSHELRTPLTSIRAFSEIMVDSQEKDGDPQQLRFLKIINEESERLSRLIDDLLDLSRIESGRQKWVMTHFNIKDAVDKSVTAVSSLIEGRKISLEVKIGNELPSINGDFDKLVQVVTNLLSNAVKFTPEEGRIDIKGGVITEDNKEFVEVSVSDTGEGIAGDQLKKIFSRFYQVDSTQTSQKTGTGLGLSICREILKYHGGKIWAESELGKGSTFHFTLPVSKKKAERKEERHISKRPVKTQEKGARSILVVDDEANIREFLKYELKREGYEVLEAENGEKALSLAREKLPDAITLDIMMPEQDGFEVLSKLKSDPKTEDIPVIIVSIVDDVEKGYRLGAYEYHQKPLDRAKFMESVKKLLGKMPKDERCRVLVVDDDRSIVEALEKMLTDEGFETVRAYDGEEALEKVNSEKPDLLVLDLKMPKMDGYDVIKRLKASDETKEIPIVVITASDLGRSRSKSMILGANEYFTKPFSKKEFVEGLKRALESSA